MGGFCAPIKAQTGFGCSSSRDSPKIRTQGVHIPSQPKALQTYLQMIEMLFQRASKMFVISKSSKTIVDMRVFHAARTLYASLCDVMVCLIFGYFAADAFQEVLILHLLASMTYTVRRVVLWSYSMPSTNLLTGGAIGLG
eukprot:4902958-Amphidinium_carterae.3